MRSLFDECPRARKRMSPPAVSTKGGVAVGEGEPRREGKSAGWRYDIRELTALEPLQQSVP
jgi:hypothetical protein